MVILSENKSIVNLVTVSILPAEPESNLKSFFSFVSAFHYRIPADTVKGRDGNGETEA
jgi:hypothetical protein